MSLASAAFGCLLAVCALAVLAACAFLNAELRQEERDVGGDQ